MSPRKSKNASRSANRTRGASGGNRSGSRNSRGSPHSRSLSAGRRAAGNASRAASTRRRAAAGRETSARSKRGRRSGSSASYAVKLLKQDHREVAQALEEFESAARQQKQAIARRICKMLTVHAQIEEELLYPAARDALQADDAHLVAEAGVEHASVKELILQIQNRQLADEQFDARVCVMGEYVKHHVSEEEDELFPKLQRTSADLDALGAQLEARKRELMGGETEGAEAGVGMPDDEQERGMPGSRSRGGRGHRPGWLHVGRR